MTESNIEARILAVRMAVRKATEEALNSASSQGPLSELQFKASPSSSTTTSETSNNENTNPNVTASESFALGMTLFGQEQAVVEKSIQEKLTKIETELSSVLKELHATASTQGRNDNSDDSSPEALQAQAKELSKRIDFLQICSRARAFLEEATALSTISTTNEPDYLAAADSWLKSKAELSEAQALVKAEESQSLTPTNALFGAYRIIDSLQTSIRRRNLSLISKATILLESSVQITSDSLQIKGGRSNEKSQGLHAAYDVMEKLSPSKDVSLVKTIQALTRKLLDMVLLPVLNNLKKGVYYTTTFENSLDGHMTSLQWNHETNGTIDHMEAWKNTFNFLQRVLTFFQETALLDRQVLSTHVGRNLFGFAQDTLSSAMQSLGVDSNRYHSSSLPLVDLLHETCLPSSMAAEHLDSLDGMAARLLKMTEPFEQEMRRIKFYSDDDRPLATFCSTFAQQYVDKRRTTLLHQARSILLHNDYHNTVQVGQDIVKQLKNDGTMEEEDDMAVFRLHKCAVSQTATLILGLCRQTMEEATWPIPNASLTMLPSTLYRTSREMLDMFRAVIPTILEQEIRTVPRIAAVLHNDCVYLAHHCLTLGLEYKDKFLPVSERDIRGQALRQTCIFVDMVPIFRELADQAMGDMLEKQQRQLHEIVGSRITLLGESLSSNEGLAEWVDAETAMKAGIYHTKHLSQTWRPVLSDDVHRRSVGFLMDSFFHLYLDQIFRAHDISEPACHFIGSIFKLGMQGAVDVTGNDLEGCLSWDRFSAVGRFTSMSLADITVALSEGVFLSLTGPELSKLIQSTFDDSDKRRTLLQALASQS